MVGWSVGWMVRRSKNEPKMSPTMTLLNVLNVLGVLGMLNGSM